MKKILSLLTAMLLITMLFPVSALAHGRCGNGSARAGYALCSTEDCSITHSHWHDQIWYSGHFIGDGHDDHEVCGVHGCTLTAVHEHDGVTCFPHNNQDGHSYHNASHKGGGRCH